MKRSFFPLLFSLLIFSFSSSAFCTVNPLDSWTLRHSEGSGALGDVAYGNGIFVAVGHSPVGTILYSNYGKSWSAAADNAFSTSQLSGLTFGEGLFVATGSGGEILVSPDGSNWARPEDTGTTATLSCAVYGNGRFVAAGTGGTVVVSDDAITWSEHSSPTANWIRGLAYHDGLYVAVGLNGVIMSSSDGKTWVESPDSGTYASIPSVTYGAGKFVAADKTGQILTSVDGKNWLLADDRTEPLSGIHYNYGIFVVAGTNGLIFISDDAINWTEHSKGTTEGLSDVASGQKTFVIVGQKRTVYQSGVIPMNLPLMVSPVNAAGISTP